MVDITGPEGHVGGDVSDWVAVVTEKGIVAYTSSEDLACFLQRQLRDKETQKIIKAMLEQLKDYSGNSLVVGEENTYHVDEIQNHLDTEFAVNL
jgi:hypothetical protein